ncbi:MAG TPA: glycosyltransferase family 2 protein [Candidatus Saccharimonadales bacterium]|jgi:hypothetical protein
MRNKHPIISTIILTWNSQAFIEDCINSVIQSSLKSEIIVIDNNSSDNTRTLVKSKFQNIELVNTGSNLGYAAGNNVGVRKVIDQQNSDYIFILNPDAILDVKCLEELVKVALASPSSAILSPKIKYIDGNALWYAGAYIDWSTGESPHRGQGEIDSRQYEQIQPVSRASGCAMLISIDAIKKVGLMDESFFLYYEETDWSVSFSDMKYEITYVPKAICRHAVSASTGGFFTPNYQYYVTRNSLLFLHKHKNHVNKFYLLRHFIASLKKIVMILRSPAPAKIMIVFAILKGYVDYAFKKFGQRV